MRVGHRWRMQTALSLKITGGRRTHKIRRIWQAKEMGVQGIPELICGGDIENDIVEINKITFAENLNVLQLTEG